MNIYQNTFETLGDPSPQAATSKREYAKGWLFSFVINEEIKRPGV